MNCKEVPEKSLFLISSLAPNQGSPVDKLSPFDNKWKSKVGGETLCLPMNPLLSALGNNSNNQDEILELILQKLSELPPTMRKILQIAEKSRLITAGKPLVLDYNALTNVLSFTVGQAGLEIVKFARDAEVVWHKNIVGNTRAFFGDLCGAKKAYARAERRKNPKYLQDVEQASLLIKELKGLLDILNKGRIDRNHNLTKSTVMEVSFKCDSLDS